VGPAASSIPTFGTDGGLQLHNLANSSGAQLSIVKFNTDTGAGTLILGKSKSATVAAGAVVANNDSLGNIVFVGDDGTDLGSSGAQITCQVDGTPGTNDMPGRLVFSTTADGASTSTERMRITSAGLVGIGTSAPGKLLEVSSSTDATIRINDPATVGTVDRYIGGVEYYTNDSSGGAKVACSIKGYHVDISGNGRLQFATGNETTAMTIDGSQRVGIGTTSPGSLLHLSTDVANGIQLQRTGSFPSLCKIFNSGSLLLFEQNSSGISFQTGSTPTEKLRIDSSGRLLVGTSTNSAVSTLVLQGNSTSSVGASFLFLQRGVSVPGTNDSLGVLTFGNNASNLGAQILSSRDGGTWTSGTSHPGRLLFFTTADGNSSPTERMRITSAGLVGIGTSTPAEILALRSSSSAIQIDTKRSDTTYGNAEILLGSPRSDTADGSTVAGRGLLSCLGNSTNTTGIVWLQAATASLATQLTDTDLKTKQCGIRLASDGSFEHWSSGSQRLKIDSSGRLLVGTSSAYTVEGFNRHSYFCPTAGDANNQIVVSAVGAGQPSIYFTRTRGASPTTQTIVQNNDALGGIRFFGSDGVDYDNPAATIGCFVDGTPGANDMPGRLVFSTTADGASTSTERMRIKSDGVVQVPGIVTGGTSAIISPSTTTGAGCNLTSIGIFASRSANPCLQLQRTTSDGAIAQFFRQNTVVGSISVTASATAYNTSSDYRLKENVVPLDGAITRLNQLPVHRFNFIADPDTVVDGFIAHEAQAVVPECVTGEKDAVDDDGNPVYQGIDQSKLVPLLTAALQEAVAKIESLEARLTAAGL
jgi:hypothetical protein